MKILIPCLHCAAGFIIYGDRHARTGKDVCSHCGGTMRAPARTGETAATSYAPDAAASEIPAEAEAWHALGRISEILAPVAEDLGGAVQDAFELAEDALAERREAGLAPASAP